ncbi:MAG: dihydrofolate reductase family protein [Acidimicrobiia bacterium]
MRKLVVTQMMSLDGVVEAPGGEEGYTHSGWVFPFVSDEYLQCKLGEVKEAEIHLLGRKTYESFAEAWPNRKDDAGFADKMNSMRKVVVSTTLKDPSWNNTSVISDDVKNKIQQLKDEDGDGTILVAGSRTLINFLKENELIDEYRLLIYPVILGSGMRLFKETADMNKLELVSSETFSNGVLNLIYKTK